MSDRSKRSQDVRCRMLRELHYSPEISQRELARRLGVGSRRTYYLLRDLIAKMLLKLGNYSASWVTRRTASLLTPKGFAEKALLVGSFLQHKRCGHDALLAEIRALDADIEAKGFPGLSYAGCDRLH